MRLIFLFVIIVLVSKIAFANVIINEIMADTLDDQYNEWVELYNNESTSINVNNWSIGDDQGNYTIEGGLYDKEGTVIEPFGYAIITSEATRVYNNFNVSDDAMKLYVADGRIANRGLKNSGETIYLYDNNGNLIDKREYNKTTKDSSWAYLNGTLHESNPTPGFSNDGSIISEQSCDFQVEFILASGVFANASEFNFKIRASKVKGSKTNFTGRASIHDLFGTLIREYKPWTNQSITRQRTSSTLTPNLEEGKSYEMNANITLQCNDTNLVNNFDTRIITIRGPAPEEESSLEILSIQDLGTDKKAKFGQTIRIKVNIYKGDTTKNSVAIRLDLYWYC